MKRWLRRIVIAAALVAVVLGIFFEGLTRVGRGHLSGEPFYEGRPASYWADEIAQWETQDAPWTTRTYQRRPIWPGWVERMLPEPRWPPLLDGDPDGLAVLQALRQHPSDEVQDWARIGIERIDDGERGPCKFYHPSVIVTAQLYEVDDAFYQEVAKAKWRSLADLEKMDRIWLDGVEKKQTGASLFDLLGKERLLLEAKKIKIENNQEAGLLSATKQINCLPSPAQLRKGEKAPQTIAVGVTVRAQVQVSSDRRFVRVTFIEKGTDVEGIDKVSVQLDGKGAVAEIACVKESTIAMMRSIPDGGSLLLPLQYRPDGAKEKGRCLVVRIEARIYIAAEERLLLGESGK